MSHDGARFDAFAALAEHRGRSSDGLLDALRSSSDPEAAGGVAAERGLPAAAAWGPATYFTDLAAPRGQRHVRVCAATGCFAARAGAHIGETERALGVAAGACDATGSVSLQRVHCLGFCYAAPASLDGDEPRVGSDLADQLAGRRDPVAPPIPVVSAVARPVVLAGIVGEQQAWHEWSHAVNALSPDDVFDAVEASGLRGRGGAGFPVVRKWAAARGAADVVVLANGDEGDPGSYADRLLMESDPERILAGLALACYAIGARHGIVLVRSEYPLALARMRRAVSEARTTGHLGLGVYGTDVDLDITVAEGAGSYVAGEESALINTLQGQRGVARPRPPYPTTAGLWNAPTVVNNVETLAALPWIVKHGGAAYARMGAPSESGTKLVSLSERFVHPGCYEVELGVSLRWIVEHLGGGLRGGHHLRALQVGGPLGGFLGPHELDTPLTQAALDDRGLALGHAGLVAIDERIAGIDVLRHVWQFAADESCGACSPCRVGSRRGLDLATGIAATDGDEYARLLRVMESGSLCAFGKRVPYAVRSLARVYADKLIGGTS